MNSLLENLKKRKIVTFSLDDQVYGVGIEVVNEIIALQKITFVPDMPSFVRGLINLRGQIMPVIDLKARFHVGESALGARDCILVLSYEHSMIGFIVDKVNEVIELGVSEIEPPPQTIRDSRPQEAEAYITGIAKKNNGVQILIDLEKVIGNKEKIIQKITDE